MVKQAKWAVLGAVIGWGAAGVGAQVQVDPAPSGAVPGPAPVLWERSLATELVAEGFANPTLALAPPDGTNRIFVLEQITGAIRIIKSGALLVSPFLDLAGVSLGGGENGLIGMAFHPGFAQNGRFYVVYNDLEGDWVLARYLVSPPNSDTALAGSGTVLLTIPQPFAQHNGGMIAFGPDRKLYASTGDGGAGNDPLNNAQNPSSLLGKILRIDVDSGSPYAIPPTNPFVGVAGTAPEIWALGLRNPWRFSIDSVTGDLWIGDVGQENREEVDFLPAGIGGQNLGWSCMEGTLCTGLGTCACGGEALTPPIYEYSHAIGCSITGGVVYRGAAIPEVYGRYFFADFCTGQVWSLREEDGVAVELVDHTADLSPAQGNLSLTTAIGTDGNGELLFLTYGGRLYRMVVADSSPDCDGDGVPDTIEIFEGTAFDVNGDGKPDECQLLLSVPDDELVLGQTTTLDFIGAQPGQEVTFFYSWRGISQGPFVFDGNLQLDLSGVNLGNGEFGLPIAGSAAANAQGQATLDWVVAPTTFTGELSFQAAIDLGPASLKSNPVQKLVSAN